MTRHVLSPLWSRSRSCRSAFLNPKFYLMQTRCLRIIEPPTTHNNGRYSGWRCPWIFYPTCAVILSAACFVTYKTSQPFRHSILALVRCSRVAGAAILSAVDYKITMVKNYQTENMEHDAYSECHVRSAKRVLRALLANGGIFIKMGQHIATLVVLPVEWTSTMKVLQDRCEPTSYSALEDLFLVDMGAPVTELFDDFDPTPIGVASLAQVHVGYHRASGQRVAVKLQHPHLAEFCDVDMEMVDVTLGWIKYWFPEFEFSWLAEEMRTNLPKEMDFVHEADNAARAAWDFRSVRTSLYIPKVIAATRRVLIMEYIQGGRVDNLKYLADWNIDRNKVAIELSRIFSRMVFINGWFHADPHAGNLLIRPAPITSKSPYNFEIVLLDHGLYFDLNPQLRVNYSKLWLSLMQSASPSTIADRRKYAELVGNVGPDLYPVFEAAITGRIALEGGWEGTQDSTFHRASSMIDMVPQTEEEKNIIRNAVRHEGVLLSLLDVLRRVPSRVLMVLKLNDLTRSLDHALMTTHSSVRIFLVTAKYCTYAVWQEERQRVIDEMREHGLLSSKLLFGYFSGWWKYQKSYAQLSVVEIFMDFKAFLSKKRAWITGLLSRGFEGAHDAASGLTNVHVIII